MIEPLAGERQRYETARAVQACNDYLRMGPGRSLSKLQDRYIEVDKNIPPTCSLQTLRTWSTRYGWVARAELYDAETEKLKNQRAAEMMRSGLALEHARVSELKKLAHFLIGQIEEIDEFTNRRRNVWLPDVKQIGSGDDAERVDIERYNTAIIGDLRGVLDDLAKETGGRRQKVEYDGEIKVGVSTDETLLNMIRKIHDEHTGDDTQE